MFSSTTRFFAGAIRKSSFQHGRGRFASQSTSTIGDYTIGKEILISVALIFILVKKSEVLYLQIWLA